MKSKHLKWLLKLNDNKPFYTQQQIGKKKSYRILYPTGEYKVKKVVRNIETGERTEIIENHIISKKDLVRKVNQRQVLPFEIIFDIDYKGKYSKLKTRMVGKEICKRLLNDGIKSSLWWSGNKGHHIHVFIKELKDMKECERMKIREIFFNEYAKEFNIDKMLKYESHMIQMEFAEHRKTQNEKTIVSVYQYGKNYTGLEKSNPLLLLYKGIINNTIPNNIRYKLIQHKITNIIKPSTVKGTTSLYNSTKKCIQYFNKSTIPEGNRDNVLFILLMVNKYKKTRDLLDIGCCYINRHSNFMTKNQLYQKIRHIKQRKYGIGCRYIRTVLDNLNKRELCDDCVWSLIR